jgi:hypothetical protein
MKEVIMKKLLFWVVLIVGTGALIGSCAKKDEATTAAAGDVAGTGTTASGTLEGNSDLTGTFHTSWYGQEPSGGCIDNSSALTAYSSSIASDTLSFKKMWIITGASTYTESLVTYSDAACSTMTSYFNKMKKTVTIGSELTGLTAGSSPTMPTTANKISYIAEKYSLMANTTASIAKHLSTYSVSLDSGTELLVDAEASETTEYNLIATGTVSGSTYLFLGNKSSADNKTDWGSSSTFWQ